MSANPIILKELIQASHRRRLFLLRIAMPVIALIILGPRMMFIMAEYHGDWRMMSQMARPMLMTCAWMMLITFMILAASEAQTNLHREWAGNTMEVLCATPIGFARIVYGKLASILVKVFSVGLALLPILGVWLSLGRMPPAMVGGALGVIVTSAVLTASLSLMNGAATIPRRKRFFNGPVFIMIYAGIVAGIGFWLRESHPLLVGAVPPWSLYCVLNDVQLGGLSSGQFALLAALEPLVIALGPILLSPWLLARTYRKRYKTKTGKRKKHWYLPGPLRRFLCRRPPLGPAENPFFWQEKGSPTLALRSAGWAVLIIVFIPILLAWAFLPKAAWNAIDLTPEKVIGVFNEPVFYYTIAWVVVGVMALAAVFCAADIFAREKSRKTLAAFMMVVDDPRKIYRAKLRAVLLALRWYYLILVILATVTCITAVAADDLSDWEWPIAILLTVMLLGPPVITIVGLVFSAAAKTSGGAIAGMVLSIFAHWAISMVISIPQLVFIFFMRAGFGFGFGVGILSFWKAR